MTDITELAQSLKAAADREMICRDGAETSEIWERTVTPENILALVEALKKAQTKAIERGRTACELFDEVTALRQRIAELESRTVKLPKPHAHLIWIQAGHAPDDYWDDVVVSHSEKDRCCDGSERYPVYARWEIEEMLAAAGIKVEDE
ncbi:hypothetical protein KPTHUN262_12020 [Klebsiella pneumoniae]|uniref:hypothetical protein n=1 Tax=Klebsiella pneumoniae TaxID=573 RepID=UPI0019153C5E|nr:hypothetical protein [Klebsiella pneumoniae]GHS64659.1 hypothetical protein KPTHUN262_12020 [Klebsiella pneumoniae]HBW8892178.1 hypothetical protein [Klebsiella pneumoniae]